MLTQMVPHLHQLNILPTEKQDQEEPLVVSLVSVFSVETTSTKVSTTINECLITAGSVEVEITGSGKTSGFAVMGKEESGGHSRDDLLLPALVTP